MSIRIVHRASVVIAIAVLSACSAESVTSPIVQFSGRPPRTEVPVRIEDAFIAHSPVLADDIFVPNSPVPATVDVPRDPAFGEVPVGPSQRRVRSSTRASSN
jgi:hypothetical protein